MSDLFYVFGIALTVAALVLSTLGLRSERFPASRGLYAAVLGVMGALVAASCAFAIVLAREEAEHRAHEIEHAAEEAEAEEAEAQSDGSEGTIETEPAEGETVTLSSPQDGALEFEPTQLNAPTGDLTIEYTNPSSVPHNVAIESGGETLAEGPTVTEGDVSTATAALEPGKYVFYCAVPGHREAGMEGILTVAK